MLTLRASKIGGCVRQYIMLLRSGREGEATPRQKLYWDVGRALEPVIVKHAGYDPAALFNDSVKVEIPINDGLVLVGHPDGEADNWTIECKTMRSVAFQDMMTGGLEHRFPGYLVQGSVYQKGRKTKGVKFLCLDKDASIIQEIQVAANALAPYWNMAVENALKIQRWLGNQKLPGKAVDLPPWYCFSAFCSMTECRHHYNNPKKMEWRRRRST